MATSKPKTAVKKVAAKPKAAAAKKPVAKSKTVASKKPVATVKSVAAPAKTKKVENKGIFSGFFAKKYEDESIMTVFKEPKFYGALLGEVIGVLLLTLVMFSLSFFGIYNAAIYVFAFIAITVAVFAFSGAHLNPIITAGMMATRRVSVVRGVFYIIAQIVGAWLGWAIFNAFFSLGGETATYSIPAMAEVAEGNFWLVTLVELFGAIILGFFFARALSYKRSVFTFAAVVAGGLIGAFMIGYIVSFAFLGLSNNYLFNPAVALMYQIFPTAGANFGEIFGGICSALATYAVFPMIGGVIGFYVADFASKLSGENN